MIEKILDLFSGNSLEIISLITGVISVYFTIKQNILCWVFGVISCFFLALYFTEMNCYANVLLQVVSIIQCLIGILNWYKKDSKEVTKNGLDKTVSFTFLSIVFGLIFTHVTTHNDNWLYLDGVSGFIALFATWLLITKKIESWWVFAISNICIIMLFIHQGSYYLVGYYTLLILMDIKGYKEWKKELV